MANAPLSAPAVVTTTQMALAGSKPMAHTRRRWLANSRGACQRPKHQTVLAPYLRNSLLGIANIRSANRSCRCCGARHCTAFSAGLGTRYSSRRTNRLWRYLGLAGRRSRRTLARTSSPNSPAPFPYASYSWSLVLPGPCRCGTVSQLHGLSVLKRKHLLNRWSHGYRRSGTCMFSLPLAPRFRRRRRRRRDALLLLGSHAGGRRYYSSI